jgi:mycofactocin system glycosyltransferase
VTLRLQADPHLLVFDGGRLLAGGHPGRVMRVSADGAALLEKWFAGEPVVSADGLAQRLVDAGLAHPLLDPVTKPLDVTVIVPVYDAAERLARCLTAIRADAPEVAIVVVDDASADEGGIARVAKQHGATLIRHEHNQGAAAARNTGLRAATTTLVAFVDCDVVVCAGWLAGLAPYLSDRVAVVAPRVVAHESAPGWLAAYEAVHSPLAMGDRPGVVGPGFPVPFVPSAALLARRDALDDGFDEALPIGEDVDLEWRIAETGDQVRYVPMVTVAHEHRTRLGEFVRRRRTYARSVGLISARHPAALPAVRVSPLLAAGWLLVVARRPIAATGVFTVATGLLARRLRGTAESPPRVAAQLMGRAIPATGLGIARAVERCWWPLLVVPAVRNRSARRALGLALWPVVADWLAAGTRPGPLAYAAGRLAGTAATTLGTWEGCAEGRTLRPLLPSLICVRRPGRASRTILRTTVPN